MTEPKTFEEAKHRLFRDMDHLIKSMEKPEDMAEYINNVFDTTIALIKGNLGLILFFEDNDSAQTSLDKLIDTLDDPEFLKNIAKIEMEIRT